MKTTLLLDDEVHRQAKQASARLGIPLTRFIEEAIRLRISTDAARRAEPVRKLPVCNSKGGLQPGVDLDNTAELLPPPERVLAMTLALCEQTDAKGNLVQDAFLAAHAMEHGCVWITTDRDFSRFPALTWRLPGA